MSMPPYTPNVAGAERACELPAGWRAFCRGSGGVRGATAQRGVCKGILHRTFANKPLTWFEQDPLLEADYRFFQHPVSLCFKYGVADEEGPHCCADSFSQ